MVLVLVDAPFAPFVASVSAPSLRATPSETRVRFEENRGQWDERIRFRARASEATVLITNDAMISMPSGVTLRLADATPSAPRGERELATKSNFFIGNDATKWRTGVRNFESVRATWRPGVDIVWHGSEGHIEYDLEVAAGVDATKLALIVDDADDIAGDDTLEMLTAAGRFVQSPPRVVQAGRELHARYVREQNALRFALDGYDAAEPLLVDPVILYSTYLGGSDSNSVSDIAIDASGNAYVTGRTLSTDFPTKNPVQSTYAGAGDAFVTKLDSTGTALVYSTYLGGSDDDDGIAIAIDASGHAYVTGLAISDDFPMKNPFDSVAGGNGKPFVAQLDASGALVYSTYLGGSTDDTATDIAVDASGDAYITGTTYSSDFPTKNPIQSALKGVTNAFLTKLNASGSALVYSTFLGGSAVEIGYGVALDASNNAYVVGQTGSSDFPTVTPFQSTLRGTYDAFVTKVNAAGSALVFSTYFGGNSGGSGGYDTSSAVAVDSSGDVYFAGTTYTSDFPTKNAAQTTAAGADDGFVAVLDSTGTSLVFSTYLGGADNDEALALALDAAGKVTVVGQTASNDFPTLNPFQLVNDGNTDAFVASYDASGALLYSSFLGGSKLDTADAVALDVNGGVYVAGATISTDFPIKGAFESTTLGETAFVTKLVAELPLGIACKQDAECGSLHCVDGVCCDTACAGQCEACDLGAGICAAVTGAPHGARAACSTSGVCTSACDGIATGSCTYAPTVCSSSCTNAMETDGICDNVGNCAAQAPRSCANLLCADANECKTKCASDADCVSGFGCAPDGTCQPGGTCVDAHTSKSADGTIKDCAPYICDTSGTCKGTCASVDDCVAPSVCDPSTLHCIAQPGAGDAGCTCTFASGHAPSRPALVLAAAIAFAWRRRRRRT